jgi:DNA polymerase V
MSYMNSTTNSQPSGPSPPPPLALVDCDNFYVSCERVFAPKLRNRPLVVLSNNDGCIISRSAEAKALDIKMGAPLHHVTALIKSENVAVRSSNYALYGDMSNRVKRALQQFSPEVEMYSIDEAFLRLSRTQTATCEARSMRQLVLRWTGIPVSIGIAETKTLAKIASRVAKTGSATAGVCNLLESPDRDTLLAETPVTKIWGIGKRHGTWLQTQGIKTALQLRAIDDTQIRRRAGVTGLRTVWELRGQSCLPLTMVIPTRKGITCSRSFGRRTRNRDQLREALATYAARAGEKLRRDGSAAGALTVFLMTNRFSSEPQYSKSALLTVNPPSDSDRILIQLALAGFERIYRNGYRYHKAGVTLTALSPANETQTDLFSQLQTRDAERLSHLLDSVNNAHGAGTIRYAATGIDKPWRMRSNYRSPCYTTRWRDIPLIPTNPNVRTTTPSTNKIKRQHVILSKAKYPARH